MSAYRDRYISVDEYKKLLEYYEILLLNNQAFFVGIEDTEELCIKSYQREEFASTENGIVSEEEISRLDLAICLLEIEDKKIMEIESRTVNRFLTNVNYGDSYGNMQTTKKTNRFKSMIIGIIMYFRSLR